MTAIEIVRFSFHGFVLRFCRIQRPPGDPMGEAWRPLKSLLLSQLGSICQNLPICRFAARAVGRAPSRAS
jgi:hypothetical protein